MATGKSFVDGDAVVTCVIKFLIAAVLLCGIISILRDGHEMYLEKNAIADVGSGASLDSMVAAPSALGPVSCPEYYRVREGETLHTISVKCGGLFITEEENPGVDDMDVAPGMVLKLSSTQLPGR